MSNHCEAFLIGRQRIKSVLLPEKSEGGEERTNLLLGVLLVGGLPLLGEPGVEEVEEGHVDGEQADHAEHHPHNNLGGQGEVSLYNIYTVYITIHRGIICVTCCI